MDDAKATVTTQLITVRPDEPLAEVLARSATDGIEKDRALNNSAERDA